MILLSESSSTPPTIFPYTSLTTHECPYNRTRRRNKHTSQSTILLRLEIPNTSRQPRQQHSPNNNLLSLRFRTSSLRPLVIEDCCVIALVNILHLGISCRDHPFQTPAPRIGKKKQSTRRNNQNRRIQIQKEPVLLQHCEPQTSLSSTKMKKP